MRSVETVNGFLVFVSYDCGNHLSVELIEIIGIDIFKKRRIV